LSIDGKHSLLPLIREVRLQFRPHVSCALRWRYEEFLIAGIRRDVPDDEIANIDGSAPVPWPKGAPTIAGHQLASVELRLPSW